MAGRSNCQGFFLALVLLAASFPFASAQRYPDYPMGGRVEVVEQITPRPLPRQPERSQPPPPPQPLPQRLPTQQNQSPPMTVLNVASLLSPPFVMLREDRSLAGNSRFEGYIKDLLDRIADRTGFKYFLRLAPDAKYGRRIGSRGGGRGREGEWTGLVGMAVRGEVDVVAADLTVTPSRLEVLDFSIPFMDASLTVLTADPNRTASSLLSDDTSPSLTTASFLSSLPLPIFAPFSLGLWLLLLAAYIVSALCLWLCARIAPKENWPHRHPRSPACDVPSTLSNSLWSLFASFFRGSDFAPRAASTRLLLGGWVAFAFAILVAYAVALAPFLPRRATAQEIREQIDLGSRRYESLEEMLDDPEFRFAVLDQGSSHRLLQMSDSSVHRRILERIAEDPDRSLLAELSEGVDRLRSGAEGGRLGVLMEATAAEFVAAKDGGKCLAKRRMYTVGSLGRREFAFAFNKGTVRGQNLNDIFSLELLKLREAGVLQALKEKWWKTKGECLDQGEDYEDLAASLVEEDGEDLGLYLHGAGASLSIENMGWAFLFLLCVLLVSIVIALIELAADVWGKKETSAVKKGEKKPAVFSRRLKFALTGCCGKGAKGAEGQDPPSAFSQTGLPWQTNKSTQTSRGGEGALPAVVTSPFAE